MLKIIEIKDGETKEKIYEKYTDLIFELLINKKISYVDLSNQYINYLEINKQITDKQLAEADYCLIETIKPTKQHKGKRNRDSIYRYLVKYKRFETAPIGEELKKYVEENNINLKGNFYTDLYNEVKE